MIQEETTLLLHTLPNGIRLVHHPDNSQVAAMGLFMHIGSRDETVPEQGLSHFIEHAIFKGTTKRKAFHILSRMDNVGAEINAYTSKEETVVYSTFLHTHYERAMELIADMVFGSIFPEKEIEREKEVVVEEINSYKDTPSEQIFDDFEEMLFPQSSLGHNILGTPDTVRSFTRQTIFNFLEKHYLTNQMVLVSVGNIQWAKYIRLAERYFSKPDRQGSKNADYFTGNYQVTTRFVEEETNQAHCILGNRAYGIHHPKRVPLMVLSNLLGGQGLNSRLNMILREKYGFVYQAESTHTSYSDTGSFTVYFATEEVNLNKSIQLVHRELDRLRSRPLGSAQLQRAKNQITGQIAIASENKEGILMRIGKQMLMHGRVLSLDSLLTRIDRITEKELLEVANEVFNPKELSMLVYR